MRASLLQEFFQPVTLFADNVTGLYTPWETVRRFEYDILQKAGQLGGYISHLMIIPPIRLGFMVMFNGDAEIKEFLPTAQSVILPALDKLLRAHNPPFVDTLPPVHNASRFLGVYHLNHFQLGGDYTIGRATSGVDAVLTLSGPALPFTPYLFAVPALNDERILRIDVDEQLFPCNMQAMANVFGAYCQFEFDQATGLARRFMFPGIAYGSWFKRDLSWFFFLFCLLVFSCSFFIFYFFSYLCTINT